MPSQRASRLRGARWIAVILGTAPACSPAQTRQRVPAVPRPDFSATRACAVVRVAAADRLVVRCAGRELELALIGVSAPARGRPDHRRTKSFLENLLLGESVYVEYGKAPAAGAGPRPAYLFRAPDGLFVNLELVRQGYARVSPRAAFEHERLFRFYEQRARGAAKGLWSAPHRTGTPLPATRASGPAASRPASPPGKLTVYVTRTGRKYHRAGCPSLRKSARPLPLAEARRQGYTPCSRCKPPQ